VEGKALELSSAPLPPKETEKEKEFHYQLSLATTESGE